MTPTFSSTYKIVVHVYEIWPISPGSLKVFFFPRFILNKWASAVSKWINLMLLSSSLMFLERNHLPSYRLPIKLASRRSRSLDFLGTCG